MGKERTSLVVGSKVKELIKSKKCLTAGDLLDGLSEKVAQMIEAATERAKKNGRSTVRSYDL